MSAGRGLLAVVAAVLAGLLLPLALVSAWTHTVVSDTDRVVDVVGPLATDDAVVAAAETSLTRRTVDLVQDRVPGDLALELGLEDVASAAVGAVVRSPQFRPAWEAATAAAHQDLLAGLRAGGTTDAVAVDLGQVLDAVLEEVGTELPVSVPPPEVAVPVTVLEGADVARARTAYDALDAAGLWLPVLVVGLLLLALVVAPRRARVLGWFGVVGAAGLALLLVVLDLARDRVVADVPRPDRALSAAVWDGVTADLRLGVWVGIGVGVALLLLAGVVGVARRAPSSARR